MNYFFRVLTAVFTLGLLTLKPLAAQITTNCVGFDDLDAGSIWGPDAGHEFGDTVYQAFGVQFKLSKALVNTPNIIPPGNIRIKADSSNHFASINQGAAFVMEFPATSSTGTANTVCFEFWGDETLLIGLNDLPPLVIPTNNPDHIIEFPTGRGTIERIDNTRRFKVCLTGNFRSLYLGGFFVNFDNICWTSFTPAACEIGDLIINPLPCDQDGRYFVTLNFRHHIPANGRIEVKGGGRHFGYFGYGDLPVKIGPFEGGSRIEHEIVVVDTQNPNCSNFAVFGPYPCTDCQIRDLRAHAYPCDQNGNFYLSLNFISQNQTDSFEVNYDDQNWGTWSYANLPVSIGPFHSLDWPNGFEGLLSVNDHENPACRQTIQFVARLNCDSTTCVGYDSLRVYDVTCDSSGSTYSLTFDMNAPTVDSFFVVIGGVSYGRFGTIDLPITIQAIPNTGPNILPLTILANLNTSPSTPGCRLTDYFRIPCQAPCAIRNLTASALSSSGSVFQYALVIDFDAVNPGNRFFDLYLNNDHFGYFPIDSLPLKLYLGCDRFSGQVDVKVQINDRSDCFASVSYQAPCRNNCRIYNITHLAAQCDSLTYTFTLDFDHSNVTHDEFDLWVEGIYVGSYLYSNLPLTITRPRLNVLDREVNIKICDKDNPDCCEQYAFPNPCVNITPCNIERLRAETLPCDSAGMFYILVNFDYTRANPTNGFRVFVNGVLQGIFVYSNTTPPVRVGPFDSSVDQTYEIVVQDVTRPDCKSTVVISGPDCGGHDCQIRDMVLEAYPCDSTGFFFVDLTFKHENTSDSFFIISPNGLHFGTYSYHQLPIKLGRFPGDGRTVLTFTVIDAQNRDCRATREIKSPDCSNNHPCRIFDVRADAGPCDSNGEFMLKLTFNHAGTGDSFYLNVNNRLGHVYYYDNLPLLLGPFEGNGQVMVFTIHDLSDRSCNAVYTVLAPDCNRNCEINDALVDVGDCLNDGTFYYHLNFNHHNTSDSFFVSGINNNWQARFSYADLPVRIGPLPGNGQYIGYIITDAAYRDCRTDFRFQAPDCDINHCSLSDVGYTASDCDSTSHFYIDVKFAFQSTSDSFNASVGRRFLGRFAYADLPVRLGPFEGDGTTVYEVVLTDSRHPDCRLAFPVQPVYCGDDCRIFNVKLEAGPCNADGFFEVKVNFDHANTSGAGFLILAGGRPFPIRSGQNVVIGPFQGDGTTVYGFYIMDLGNPLCFAYEELGPVDCRKCTISNLQTRLSDCDSTGHFYVFLDFVHQNTSNGGFQVKGNGRLYGTFRYDQLPVKLGPFVGDGQSVYELVVSDVAKPDCSNHILIRALNCRGNDCRITDLVAAATPCTPDGNFFVDLKFQFRNVGASGFTVRGNGRVYGRFQYNQLPVRLGPFPGDGRTIYEFVVIDNANNQCQNSTTVGPVRCQNLDCEIYDLVAKPGDCNPDGSYQLRIDFKYRNTNSRRFEVYSARGLIGTFELSDLPILIQQFRPSGNGYDVVKVCIDDNNRCCADIRFQTPNCFGSSKCVEFESLPAGGVYRPRPLSSPLAVDTLTVENGVVVSLHSFLPSLTALRSDSVTTDSVSAFFEAGQGIAVTTHNASLRFQIPRIAVSACTEISFDFFQPGSENNISFNGQPLRIFERFSDLPAMLAPGVRLTLDLISPREGRVTLRGNIESVVIGGEILSLDNFCFKPCNTATLVWPGDANTDKMASHIDLLNIGVAFGEQDLPRPEVSKTWSPKQGENWMRNFNAGPNFSNADCNGDGIVDRLDVEAIELNYGKINGEVLSFPSLSEVPNATPLFIEFPDSREIEMGVPFKAKIHLGTEEIKAMNMYGLAFTMRYDPEKMRILDVIFPAGWFGQPGEDVLTMDRIFDNYGMAHIAMVRNNQENVSGKGVVVEFIGIIDVIVGKVTKIDVDISDVLAISKNEIYEPVQTPDNFLDFSTQVINLEKGSVTVFPNPTADKLFIRLEGNSTIEKVEILGLDGKLFKSISDGFNTIPLGDLPPGIFILKLDIDGKSYFERVIKQ